MILAAPIFGTGIDGDVVNTSGTLSPPDSAFTGTAGATSGTAKNVLVGLHLHYPVLIHQTSGTSAGQWERNFLIGYSPGTVTLAFPLTNTYTTGAQIVRVGQY